MFSDLGFIISLLLLIPAFITLYRRKYGTFFFISVFSLLISAIPLSYKFAFILPISYLLFFLLSYDNLISLRKKVTFSCYSFLSIFLGTVPHTLTIAFSGVMGYIYFRKINVFYVFMLLITSFIEELFFRVKLPNEYNKFRYIASSVYFSLFHFPLFRLSYKDIFFIFFIYLFLGLSLQIIYNYYGFINSFLLHSTYNIIAVNYMVSLDIYSIFILVFSQIFLLILVLEITEIEFLSKLHAYMKLFLLYRLHLQDHLQRVLLNLLHREDL